MLIGFAVVITLWPMRSGGSNRALLPLAAADRLGPECVRSDAASYTMAISTCRRQTRASGSRASFAISGGSQRALEQGGRASAAS